MTARHCPKCENRAPSDKREHPCPGVNVDMPSGALSCRRCSGRGWTMTETEGKVDVGAWLRKRAEALYGPIETGGGGRRRAGWRVLHDAADAWDRAMGGPSASKSTNPMDVVGWLGTDGYQTIVVKRKLRNESTPEGKKIWADVDKTAARAPSASQPVCDAETDSPAGPLRCEKPLEHSIHEAHKDGITYGWDDDTAPSQPGPSREALAALGRLTYESHKECDWPDCDLGPDEHEALVRCEREANAGEGDRGDR